MSEISFERLTQIIDEGRMNKTSRFPSCCPWALASTLEIVSMAEEITELRKEKAMRVLDSLVGES